MRVREVKDLIKKVNSLTYEMDGETYKVFSEYTPFTLRDYQKIASDEGVTVIGGYLGMGVNVCVTNGDTTFVRSKVHLTTQEKRVGLREGKAIYPFTINDHTILPILCYEICFPEDYYPLKDSCSISSPSIDSCSIDLITHHVGYPMKNHVQYQPWKALQEAMAIHFQCPVISVCGGELNKMNLTGIIGKDSGL